MKNVGSVLGCFLLGMALSIGPIRLAAADQPTVEVLHYWTSGSESKAVATLRKDFEANGGRWIDSPVAGGGGDTASTVLRARVLAGDPPNVAQLKGPNIQEWAEEGSLAELDDIAQSEGWLKTLPSMLRDILTYKGHLVAVPVNVHRVNWLWVNPKVFAKVGLSIPTTWDEFNAAAEKLKEAGYIPLAHGGQPWQDATIFENVVLGIGGTDFYRRALVDFDRDALASPTMVKVFDEMRKIRGYVDDGFPGREWNLATNMLINGQAAMQIMGDWAKGEFMAAGRVPGRDIVCAPIPGQDGFVLNTDSFVMFKTRDPSRTAGQKMLARLLLGAKFQETFNLVKGSIPIRPDLPLDQFDVCATLSSQDLAKAIRTDTLLPSLAHDMAVRGALRGVILDVVTSHFNSSMSSQEAVKQLVDAVELAR